MGRKIRIVRVSVILCSIRIPRLQAEASGKSGLSRRGGSIGRQGRGVYWDEALPTLALRQARDVPCPGS